MTLGLAERQGELLDDLTQFCDEALPSESIYAFLHRERDHLFPDELFCDLFTDRGRRSVPPSVVASVMVLQRLEGCSDREATERYTFDARWRYAAGVGGYDTGGRVSFVHTVLVDMRERLRRSDRPDRVFEVTLAAARSAGLVGRRRVLDSTALYDAVATMDTVTLVRSAIRGLLAVADETARADLKAVLRREDDYATPGKPACDWDDPSAREELVDALARDAMACLGLLQGRVLSAEVAQAAELLAAVTGQDLDKGDDEKFRIARRVAPDRIISTVDREARHGHKTSARGFDGYKAHVAIDPDSEIITATAVTPANTGDAQAATTLLAECLSEPPPEGHDDTAPVVVYGDSAYGTGELLERLDAARAVPMVKVQAPVAPAGHFSKDRFAIDLAAQTVTCPAGVTAALRARKGGGGEARFGAACATCPLASSCTSSPKGRVVNVGPHEALLAEGRARQRDPAWAADYRATRPRVERKISHLVRRRHGGRRARVRGRRRAAQDFSLLGAAVNLARLAVLKASSRSGVDWALVAT